jgi:hypothetical protein
VRQEEPSLGYIVRSYLKNEEKNSLERVQGVTPEEQELR